MAIEEYAVALADAPARVRELLGRPDVANVSLLSIEGDKIADVPGTADPDDGAAQVLGSLDEPEGGSETVRLVVETSGLRRTERGIEGLDLGREETMDREEPLEEPEFGEPEPH